MGRRDNLTELYMRLMQCGAKLAPMSDGKAENGFSGLIRRVQRVSLPLTLH